MKQQPIAHLHYLYFKIQFSLKFDKTRLQRKLSIIQNKCYVHNIVYKSVENVSSNFCKTFDVCHHKSDYLPSPRMRIRSPHKTTISDTQTFSVFGRPIHESPLGVKQHCCLLLFHRNTL
jgi:hypothetical protein